MVNAVLGLIGTIIYPLFSIVFLLLDVLQGLFYSFAGIGSIAYGNGTLTGTGSGTSIDGSNPTGSEKNTGLLYYLMNSDIVKNILISMMILALFLLVIFTTLAFLKSIYSEKPKSWKDILSSAVKGLVNFIVLPVCCLLGVWVGNIILQAVNGATSTGGATTLSRKLFVCVSYNANVYRGTNPKNDNGALINELLEKNDWLKSEVGLSDVESDKESEYYAQILDQIFAVQTKKGNQMPILWYWNVSPYYRLVDINYFLLIVGGVFMMYVMVNVTYGMIKRLFILLMLFVVSPALCAMYPLDDGGAVKAWSGDVKKNILSAYGAVAGMNLLFSFMPIVQNIKIVFGWAADVFFINDIVQLILMICLLFCMNDFISMITGYIGGGNAFADGKSLRGQTQGAIKKYGKSTVEKGVKVGGAFVRANKARADRQAELASQGQGNSFTRFFRSAGTGALQLGQEGLTGLFNSANKAASGALGLESKAIKPGDGTIKAWESTGIGKLIKSENDADKTAARAAENSARWKNLRNNLSDDELQDPAMLSELKRQMLASGIKEEDLYKKGYLGSETDKGAIEEKIARFNEMDYDERKADLQKARETIVQATSKDATTRQQEEAAVQTRAGKNSLADAVDSSGKVYIDARDAEVNAEKAETKATSALSTAQANFDSLGVPMTDVEKASRLSMGMAGKYSDADLIQNAENKAVFDSMKEFNASLEALVRATETQQKAMEDHAKATSAAKKSLSDFENALDKAKSISKDAATSIQSFGKAAGKVQTDVDALTQKLRDEANKST